MKFTQNNSSLELSIIGYQFPDAMAEPYDSNWLIIQLKIEDSQGKWGFVDPCLLTYEVSRLADWFDKINLGIFKEIECDFMEPVISFRITDYNQQKLLSISFTNEALPIWAQSQNRYFVEFALAEIDLESASHDLRKQLKKYPPRATE